MKLDPLFLTLEFAIILPLCPQRISLHIDKPIPEDPNFALVV